MAYVLGPLRNDELAQASALCLRSKAHWGYDAAFIEACRDELSLTPEDLVEGLVVAARAAGRILGVAQLCRSGSGWELEKLFVDPPAMGGGVGRALFDWAVAKVAHLGGTRIAIAADPDAAPFYRRLGATDAGRISSGSIPGRSLPLLHYDIAGPT